MIKITNFMKIATVNEVTDDLEIREIRSEVELEADTIRGAAKMLAEAALSGICDGIRGWAGQVVQNAGDSVRSFLFGDQTYYRGGLSKFALA